MEIWNISQWWAITILLYSSHVSGFPTYTIGDHKLQRLNRLTWKSIKSVNLAVDQPEDEIQQNKPTNLFFDRATLSSLLVGNELTSTIKNQKTVSLTRVAVALIFIQFCGSQILQFFLTGFQNGVAWYLTQLEASPIITKSITSGIIGIFGDYFAQLLEFKMKRRRRKSSKWKDCLSIHGHYDTRRGLAILGDGLFISGPLMHWAYNRFEDILPIDGHWAAMTHVVADSILLDSVFITTAFIMTGLLEGYSFVNEIIPQFKKDFPAALKASWATSLTLVPLEFVCFRYLPLSFRTLAMNLTDVFWDGVVSFMTHRNRVRKRKSSDAPIRLAVDS